MAWHAKPTGEYAKDSTEAYDNCVEIYGALSARGWTLNAVCGLIGNISREGAYNPWRWQGDHVRTEAEISGAVGGYGLVQFTPARKYIWDERAQAEPGYGPNFADKPGLVTDGNAQILFIDSYADYYETDSYPLNYQQYKESTANVRYLTEVWMWNYERPPSADPTLGERQDNAEYWYGVLSGTTPPDPPDPPIPGPINYPKSGGWWMYMRRL